MSTQPRPRLSEAEYLEIERKAETRSEYHAGEMYALAGASLEHNQIVANVIAALHGQLRGGPCRVLPGDLRVKARAIGLYTYPDVVLVCGDPVLEDAELDTLLNPKLIVEVLSPSTEGYDRGKKYEFYRTIDSFTEYLLVAQDRVYVEHHVKLADGSWKMTETADRAAELALETGGCRLRLAEVYEGIALPG